ncbi:MAG: PD-(D/E)XK nuclease family protein, partial [Oscillospiraceae bacterium]|nr:PD-(D/E)XK nuclease family protein [Oscillospiraceae bacterium]
AAFFAKSFLDWALLGVNADRGALLETVREKKTYMSGNIGIHVITDEAAAHSSPEIAATPPDPLSADILRKRTVYQYPRAELSNVPTKVTASGLTHGYDFMSRPPSFANPGAPDAAMRGTVIHLFMQHADFKAAAVSVSSELERLTASGLISAEHAESVDLAGLERFFEGPLGKRASEGEILREYAFIDAIDAIQIKELPAALADEKVMVQGVVDCIIFENSGAVLVDYKTDRVTSPDTLIERYHRQLSLYKQAVESHFSLKVTESYIYSFHLGMAVRL